MLRYDLLDKYSVHYVVDESYGSYIDAHTHGLLESYNHKDIQIVLPFAPEYMSDMMNFFVSLIDYGERLEPGVQYIWDGHVMEPMEVWDGKRSLLRMIVLDDRPESPVVQGQKAFSPEEAYRNGSIT